MRLMARVHQERSSTIPPMSLKDPALAALFRDHVSTTAGIAVTYELAFTYSAVYDAVNQIANDVAKMPLNLMKRRATGGADAFTASPLFRLLKFQPNPEMGSMVFRRQMMVWALTSKGAHAEIQRDGAGRPVGLWPLEPHRVQPFRDERRAADGRLLRGPIRYGLDGQTAHAIDDADMLVITGIGYTPGAAYSVLDKARQAVGLAIAAERFGAAFFGNGLNFGGVLTSDGPAPVEEQQIVLRKALEGLHQGPDRAHKMALLWGGFKFEKTGVAPNEAQMNELRDKQVEEVARFYRMPPHRLGLNKPGTVSYSSVEMAQLDYYQGCLLDWVTQWEEELNRKCIAPLEQRQQFIKHNANVFLRGDIKSRYDALGVARDKGIINANEWRDLEDMNPQDGDQGNLYLVQTAQTPLSLLAALVQAQIDKTTAEAEHINDPPPPTPAPTDGGAQAVQEANARAARADAAALAAREDVARLTAELAVRQANEASTAEALAGAREELSAAQTLATQLTGLSVDLRRQAEQTAANHLAAVEAEARAVRERDEARTVGAAAIAERDASHAQTIALELDLQALRSEVSSYATKAGTLQANLDTVTQERTEALARIETCERQVVANSQLSAEARATLEAAVAEARSTVARLTEESARITVDLAAARAALSDTETKRVSAEEALDAHRLTAAEERTVLQARIAALEEREARLSGQVDALSAGAVAHDDRAAALAEARESLARTQVELRQACNSLKAAQQEAMAAKTAEEVAKRAEEAANTAQVGALAATIQAHHGLVVDIMRRMIERETDRARRAQTTTEKFRAWFEGSFYADHEELCVRALLPAVQIHVAFLGAVDNAQDEARHLVRAHISDSQRQLRTILDGDADDLASSLPSLLARWDEERPRVIADRLMERELEYVRQR